jgi:hypothetical protein
VLAQLCKQAKAVTIRQVQVQQNNFEIGVLLDQPLRLIAICGFQDVAVAPQFFENAPQGLANQDVIVDQKKFHVSRYCLALAKVEGALALTAERRWTEVADVVGVAVEVIR